MKITDFRLLVCKHEGLKKQVDIAQIAEILRVVNDLTYGDFYKDIRSLPEDL